MDSQGTPPMTSLGVLGLGSCTWAGVKGWDPVSGGGCQGVCCDPPGQKGFRGGVHRAEHHWGSTTPSLTRLHTCLSLDGRGGAKG